MQALGIHILLDLWGLPFNVLNDLSGLTETLTTAAKDAGATIVDERFTRFSPHGISGVVIIAESHVTVHTWPERGYAAMDVFTCGAPAVAHGICKRIISALSPSDHQVRVFDRGAFTPTLKERAGNQ